MRNSPILYPHDGIPSLIIARGSRETVAFVSQHDWFVSAMGGFGRSWWRIDAGDGDLAVASRQEEKGGMGARRNHPYRRRPSA